MKEIPHYYGDEQVADLFASSDYTQWKRLSKQELNPLDQAYSRIKRVKDKSNTRHQQIVQDLVIHLLSPNRYIRKYAELVMKDQKFSQQINQLRLEFIDLYAVEFNKHLAEIHFKIATTNSQTDPIQKEIIISILNLIEDNPSLSSTNPCSYVRQLADLISKNN